MLKIPTPHIFGLFPETHGEICRLGYLRLVPLFLEYSKNGVVEPTTSGKKLLSFIKYVDSQTYNLKHERTKLSGVLGEKSSEKSASYYVKLAKDLGLLDNNLYLPLLRASKSFQLFQSSIVNSSFMEITHTDFLKLTNGDKLIFTYILAKRDPLFPEIIKWAKDKKSFRRFDAMVELMENVLPQIISETLSRRKTSEEAAANGILGKTLEKLNNYKRIREELYSAGKSSEWIRTKSYNMYRHTIPPRLEWMVDLGYLEKNTGKQQVSRYQATELLRRCSDDVYKLSRADDVDKIFNALNNISSSIALSATRSPYGRVIRRFITKTFKTISNEAPQEILVLASCANMIDEDFKVTINMIERELQKMELIGLVHFRMVKGSLLITSIKEDIIDTQVLI